jgi:hypothetical protein
MTSQPQSISDRKTFRQFFSEKIAMYTGLICVMVLAAIAAFFLVRRQLPGQRGFELPPGAYRSLGAVKHLKPTFVCRPAVSSHHWKSSPASKDGGSSQVSIIPLA